ncbi:MBOAT family O-acyltransferase [Butyrivibrio sp. CB08]|uniref:MBOAT family O-acyltransferase n=1 Tax=Butyrivibrio sp. CB08 TaxID=2364879 RepID=UPI0021109ECE|nr:MBOAT family O-acyltransferase [Butyrivibrio sp. CB08]
MKTYINIFIVFVVSGVWHGANWTFILWGVLHGIANIITRALNNQYQKMHVAFQWFITFISVNILWLLFRADSISQWIRLVLRMIKMENLTVRDELLNCFSLPEKPFITDILHLNPIISKAPFVIALFFIIMGFCICLNHRNNIEKKIQINFRTSLIAAILLFCSIVSLGGVSVFIYFNF